MKTSHQIRLPAPALRPFVKCFLDISMGQHGQAFQCALPAKLEQCIFFSTGDIPVIGDTTGNNGNILSVNHCCHVRGGVNSNTLQLKIDGALDMFVVIFQPSGFFRFFNMPASHFSDTFTVAAHSLGKEWEYLGESVREAAGSDRKTQLIERYLLRLLRQPVITNSMIDQTIMEVIGQPSLSVSEMAKQSFLSERQFRRKFMERTGLSPQAFSRISRISLAMKMKRNDPLRSWRSIAFESGFTDQSHFRKEMKSLMGIDHPANGMDDQFVNVEGTDFKLLAQQK